jgi:hypothetical protein
MFWKFSLGLFLISLIFPFIYSLLSIPEIGLMGLLFAVQDRDDGTARKTPVYFISYPIMAIMFLLNVYILCGWSAYVALRALVYSSAPAVTHRWLYFVVGFILCHGPLGFMASKEGPESSSGSCLHICIAMAAYVLFCIWPKVMVWPYGWFLGWIYGV